MTVGLGQRRALLRAVDANVNRAREGLRVAEDVARFCLAMPSAYRRLRALRHGLEAPVRGLGVKAVELAGARDTERDPGRFAKTSAAKSVEHLLLINLQRTKEALRVIEEAGRLLAPRQAARFQQLRFQTYDAERAILLRLAAVRHPRSRRRARA
ncbi:MAG: hypothetical protein HYZ92_02430 [Candidatus Omnitrophica bacterium]|nr:hypothetical protein [Candidatus Omnitrophota bacterium]